jgi:hypothetical protein
MNDVKGRNGVKPPHALPAYLARIKGIGPGGLPWSAPCHTTARSLTLGILAPDIRHLTLGT